MQKRLNRSTCRLVVDWPKEAQVQSYSLDDANMPSPIELVLLIGPPVYKSNGKSIGWATFAQITAECRRRHVIGVRWCQRALMHIGTTWRIRLNRPSAATMRPPLCQITLTSLVSTTGRSLRANRIGILSYRWLMGRACDWRVVLYSLLASPSLSSDDIVAHSQQPCTQSNWCHTTPLLRIS